MERPPPHSVDAIRARRAGGKKVPKAYRKYHPTHKNTQKDKAHGISHGFMYVVRGLRGAFEALR
jgi:hypothetical protein